MGGGTCLEWLSPLGKSSPSLGMKSTWWPLAWHGVPQVTQVLHRIKKLDAYALKNKKKPNVGVELRAGGDPHRSEKPGCSAGDTRQWPKQKMHRYPVSPKGVLLLGFFGLLKVSKIFFDLFKIIKVTMFNYDLFKDSKMTILKYDLFNVIKMTNNLFTVRKMTYDLFKVSKMTND